MLSQCHRYDLQIIMAPLGELPEEIGVRGLTPLPLRGPPPHGGGISIIIQQDSSVALFSQNDND